MIDLVRIGSNSRDLLLPLFEFKPITLGVKKAVLEIGDRYKSIQNTKETEEVNQDIIGIENVIKLLMDLFEIVKNCYKENNRERAPEKILRIKDLIPNILNSVRDVMPLVQEYTISLTGYPDNNYISHVFITLNREVANIDDSSDLENIFFPKGNGLSLKAHLETWIFIVFPSVIKWLKDGKPNLK